MRVAWISCWRRRLLEVIIPQEEGDAALVVRHCTYLGIPLTVSPVAFHGGPKLDEAGLILGAGRMAAAAAGLVRVGAQLGAGSVWGHGQSAARRARGRAKAERPDRRRRVSRGRITPRRSRHRALEDVQKVLTERVSMGCQAPLDV